jgi:hypothetical protein
VDKGGEWERAIGEERSLTAYQVDDFESGRYRNLAWVNGVLTLYTGDSVLLALETSPSMM